jgi:hypothetical protein
VSRGPSETLILGCSKRLRGDAHRRARGRVRENVIESLSKKQVRIETGVFRPLISPRSVFMSLRSPTDNEKGVRPSSASSRTSLSFSHASSGNLGGVRTGPPIKKFGGDDLGESHLFTSAAIFERAEKIVHTKTPD